MKSNCILPSYRRPSERRGGRGVLPVVVLLLLSAALPARGQDIHFSQVDLNPILLNPAYSGFFNGTGRVGLCYRNQWASVGQAFQTWAVSAEVSLLRRRRQRDGLSLGLWAYNDRAGELRYGTSAATAALSYYLALDREGGCFLSGGVELGYGQTGFDAAAAQLLDAEEVLLLTSAGYPLVGAGLALYLQPHDDFYLKVGASGRNLNRPRYSFLGQAEQSLDPKYNLYSRAEWRLWSDVALLPVALCQWQRQNREWVVGCDVKWYISEGAQPLSLLGGMHYRVGDALYMQYTLEWNAFLLAVAYDANLSKLTPASHSVGAFELGLLYRIHAKPSTRRRALPCPIL